MKGHAHHKQTSASLFGLQDYKMNDLGLMETIKVEHVFTFRINDKWERPIRKCVDALLVMGYHMSESLRLLTYGAVGYMALVGTAKLIEAMKSSKDIPPSSGKGSSSRSGSDSPVMLDLPEKATGHTLD
jgi:hypothetical protein